LAKVTGPNQFSLAVGHQTTAKVDEVTGKRKLIQKKEKNNTLEFQFLQNKYTMQSHNGSNKIV
jgi:hypothetical protein